MANKLEEQLKSPIPAGIIIKHDSLKINGLPYEYIPIQWVEDELYKIFGLYDTEIKSVIFNNNFVTVIKSLMVTVGGENYSHDGVASVEITKDTPQQLAISIANSVALKNAAENFGEYFGQKLNRGLNDLNVIHSKEKPKMDIITIALYEKALKEGDTKKIVEIETAYSTLK